MRISRYFDRNRRRGRAASPSQPPRDFFVATAGVPGMPGDLSDQSACECPVCRYLQEIAAPIELLPDGTVIHRLTRAEHDEVSALTAAVSPRPT